MRARLAPNTVGGVTLLQVLALSMPTAIAIGQAPANRLTLLAVAITCAIAWESVFTALRKSSFGMHSITTALIVMILIPPDISIWQLALAISLGVVFGELVFGGRGFGFVAPATVTLAILLISFPDVQLIGPSRAVFLATLPGLLMLLAVGLISWRVILAVVITVAIALPLNGHWMDIEAKAVAMAFGLTFLIGDPISASATPAGRWVYGGLAGALIVLFSPVSEVAAEALVFAALLAGVFAPLIDHVVVLLHAGRRRMRCNA